MKIPKINLVYAIWMLTAACNSPVETLPSYHSPDFTPVWDESAIETPHQVTPFMFTDQHGQKFGTDELQGKIHVMNCFFTVCPSLCPRLMGNLKEVQKVFENDAEVQMISLSVTPERDSVAQLADYAQQNDIGKNWHLLTGNKAAIYTTARQSYFVDENIGTELNDNDFLHTENIILADRNGRIRGIYNGSLPLEIEQLIRDIEILKKE